ncbi:hypothetical protein HZH66_010252 [Vespula vulgaris]|uniref:Uncharacterized protein n=1 Tax=Vespula vulgaris TaxID=7454 RepID=A0A834MXP2_VESVU|nr:hypothetical protein HZH66_010252 [Vespula vulgaris]
MSSIFPFDQRFPAPFEFSVLERTKGKARLSKHALEEGLEKRRLESLLEYLECLRTGLEEPAGNLIRGRVRTSRFAAEVAAGCGGGAAARSLMHIQHICGQNSLLTHYDFLEDLEREDVTEEMLVVRQDLPRQIFFEEYEEDIKDVVLRRHSTYMLR